MKTAFLSVAIVMATTFGTAAHAGWLTGWLGGPKTYDECYLEKMKGRNVIMDGAVKKVCRADFPCPEGQEPGISFDTCYAKATEAELIEQKQRRLQCFAENRGLECIFIGTNP